MNAFIYLAEKQHFVQTYDLTCTEQLWRDIQAMLAIDKAGEKDQVIKKKCLFLVI